MSDDEMMTLAETCQFFGGKERPIDKVTLYRWIKKGLAPKPVKVGRRFSRWRRSECQMYRDNLETPK